MDSKNIMKNKTHISMKYITQEKNKTNYRVRYNGKNIGFYPTEGQAAIEIANYLDSILLADNFFGEKG